MASYVVDVRNRCDAAVETTLQPKEERSAAVPPAQRVRSRRRSCAHLRQLQFMLRQAVAGSLSFMSKDVSIAILSTDK